MVMGCASLHTNWRCGLVLCLVVIWGLVGALVGVYCLFGGRDLDDTNSGLQCMLEMGSMLY